ncbi:TraR/DksA C4-type zinc finger protein [Rhodovulum tesquicola]|uniref:TraR/DksA family transcriptional regulator n=1 Tax=Rhodovulum tesquicola TaxID=540254 RepID=UPI0020974310|nr:TraR/DksA C4-type zinc finger protein [Rhodovulum tesquicola]MCO8145795.1 TraR/DksA C4-type zinc finger protein [Rhodovulum tesquicola]
MTDAPDPDALKALFLPRLRAELDALRSASASTAADRRPVELDQQSVGRLSRMDAIQQQAMAAAQDARRHARGRALDAAIRRIGNGEFGWCADCGDFIGLPRLDLDPTMTRCTDCAR